MTLTINLSIKVFIIMLLGILANRIGVLEETGKKKLSELLVNIVLPVSMIASSQQAFSTDHLKGIGIVALICSVYYVLAFLLGGILGKILHMDAKKSAIFTLLIGFANTGFLGISVISEIVGSTGVLYAVIYNCVFDIFYFSYGQYILESGKEKIQIKRLISNPIIWVSIITVVLYLIPWRMPEIVVNSLGTVGNIMMPISMLIIGAEIGSMRFKQIFTDVTAFLVSFIRMILIPSITLGIMIILDVGYEIGATAVILSAMPSGSLNVIMAQKYDAYPKFSATAVMQTTILMILTLPVFSYMCQTFL